MYYYLWHALLQRMSKEEKYQLAFGELVRELRKEKGLSQEKLAELSDLHVNYISFLERGKRQPTLSSLIKIAEAFNFSLSSLLKMVEEKI